jgi:hypothetical protein
VGSIPLVVDSRANSCYSCFYLARLYKCDTVGMGLKRPQKTRQRLPNTACSGQWGFSPLNWVYTTPKQNPALGESPRPPHCH